MKKNSYAKINLALNVLNHQRPKGLHDLDMLNTNITLKDTIKIKFKDDSLAKIVLKCDYIDVPLDEKNLIYQVILKVQKKFNLSFSCLIIIHKNIPLCAGLGGGSSNAATTLLMLNQHFKLKMTPQQMIDFIFPITSDGAYFILGGLCRIRQCGNQVLKLPYHFKQKIVLLKPHSGCRSKEVYDHLNYATLPHCNILKLMDGIKEKNIELMKKHITNSLMDSAMTINKELSSTYQLLKDCGFDIVCMSGSGSTFFAFSEKKKPYSLIKKKVKKGEYELFGFYQTF